LSTSQSANAIDRDAAVTAHNAIFINREWIPSSEVPPFGLAGQEVQDVLSQQAEVRLQRPLRMGQ
jgi:hypothetical protein